MRPIPMSIFAACLAVSSPAFADTVGEIIDTDAAVQAWQPSDGAVIDFTVLRQGKPFGYHKVSFSEAADGTLSVTSDVSLQAKLGPITVFRYKLDATETWEDGRLIAVEGKTNDDGKRKTVTAKADGDIIAVNGSSYQGEAPGDILPSSHWHMGQAFSTQILSTESGLLIPVEPTKIGRETVVVGDTSVEADHYRLVSDITIDLWYDDQARWVKLAFEARGQQIEYSLNSLY